MANELPNEQELYDEIKRAGVSIDSRLWKILSHHIGNDIQVIHLGVKCLSEMPPWIRHIYTLLLRLHKKFDKRFTVTDITAVCKTTLERVDNISLLLDKLRSTVKREPERKDKRFIIYDMGIREL